jgi:ABC-type transport system involved in multi-copper enzyme maturation permease subunit
MSAAAAAIPAPRDWRLWRSQGAAVLWMELKKNFITKRGFWIYLLAAAPVVIVWLHTIVTLQRPDRAGHDMSKDTEILAVIFQMFFLRPAVFFGCVGIFTYLFRGEVLERSLHYYFLAPVRREVLVIAKYLAGAITAVAFFGGSILLTFWGMYGHFPSYEVSEWMFGGAGLSHLLAYLSITVLACVSWGAVFLYMGIRWRNPIVPSVTFLLWESLNLFLPAWLRKISVLHYLQSLTPVQGDLRGPGILFGQTADPVPAWLAVLCLAGITAGMLFLSVRRLKRTEISYSTD